MPATLLSSSFMPSKNSLSKLPPPANSMSGAAALLDESRARQRGVAMATNTSPNPSQHVLESLRSGLSAPLTSINGSQPNNLSSNSSHHLTDQNGPKAGPERAETPVHRLSEGLRQDFTIDDSNQSLPVASPTPMDEYSEYEGDEEERRGQKRRAGSAGPLDEESRSRKAFTFPGHLAAQAYRTSSLPHSNVGRGSGTSQGKRHKCPHCSVDFTRQHNLNSHLLTHSQERPFSCDKCDARFRRLHDLKRHTKLHTGERPHVCSKCERSFARGDALARHSKGSGGCAGRRASVGSLAGDDPFDDSRQSQDDVSMTGVKLSADHNRDAEQFPADDSGTQSSRNFTLSRQIISPTAAGHSHDRRELQSSRSHQSSISKGQQIESVHPPVASSISPGLAPPSQAFSSHHPSFVAQGATSSIQGMMESPKTLSPGPISGHSGPPLNNADALSRNRSSSHPHLPPTSSAYRQSSVSNLSASMALPAPHITSHNMTNSHQLPPLQGLNPPDSRYSSLPQSTSLPSNSAVLKPLTNGPSSPGFAPTSIVSAGNSLSSHSTGARSSTDRSHLYGAPFERLWACIDGLTARLNRLEDEVASLKDDAARG